MRNKPAIALLTSLLLLVGISPSIAEDASQSPSPSATLSRAEQVLKFHTKYDPMFDAQYKRLMVIQSKITYNASMKGAFKDILKDFQGVRAFLENGLASNTEGIEIFVSYADEELGEFENTMYLLEKEISKSKTITCVKGKTVKKVMALKPKCPSGYSLKK